MQPGEELRLYYPVKPFSVNQNFGENRPCVRNFGQPNQQVINSNADGTCPLGSDKLYPHFGMSGHNGSDLAAEEQEVRAACAGTVIEMQSVPARGLGLGILTDVPVKLGMYGTTFVKIRYWHLKSFNVGIGQKVEAGDLLGISNNTGFSSKNHLHFEGQPMRKDEGGHPYLAYPDSVNAPKGVIAGAIDLAPFFTGIYAEDLPRLFSLNKALITALQSMVNFLRTKNG